MRSSVFSLRVNGAVHETNILAQRNSNILQYAVQWTRTDSLKLRKKCFNPHAPNDQTLFHLLYTSILFVPVFTETLSRYFVGLFLERKFCSDYEIPAPNGNGTVTLPGGTGVYIPVLGFHFDPTYFPEPEKFDSDRFTEENKRSRPN
jgi:hypothetical protein